MTAELPWTEEDSKKAIAFWEEYQKTHDVTPLRGQAVGIDPKGGRVWFGESAIEIVEQQEAEGVHALVYLLRVGQDYYMRKG